MNRGGHRFFAICLILIVFLVWPVQADAIQAVRTHVFFEKEGLPYNEPVIYAVKCYGVPNNPTQPADTSDISGVIYQYSATCPEYGCGVWQPDTHAWRYIFDHCELQGETLGRNFTINNISLFSSCENMPATRMNHDPSHRRTANEYYFWGPEAYACKSNGKNIPSWPLPKIFFETCDTGNERQCMELFDCTPPVRIISFSEAKINNTPLESGEYREYLESCNPVSDDNCPGWIVDGEPLKDNPSCIMNSSLVQDQSIPCGEYLVKASPLLILPEDEWQTGNYGVPTVLDICDSVWTIPSDDIILATSGSPKIVVDYDEYMDNITWGEPVVTDTRRISPVELVYCSIVEFLGGRCE